MMEIRRGKNDWLKQEYARTTITNSYEKCIIRLKVTSSVFKPQNTAIDGKYGELLI